jgi:hypothetical protein
VGNSHVPGIHSSARQVLASTTGRSRVLALELATRNTIEIEPERAHPCDPNALKNHSLANRGSSVLLY